MLDRRLRRLPGTRAQPAAEAAAAAADRRTRHIGTQLFATNCSACHGKGAVGGSAPVLNSKQFLKSTTDDQIHNLIAGGVPGTEMPAWSLAFGGTLTDEQIRPDHDVPALARAECPERPHLAERPRLSGAPEVRRAGSVRGGTGRP